MTSLTARRRARVIVTADADSDEDSTMKATGGPISAAEDPSFLSKAFRKNFRQSGSRKFKDGDGPNEEEEDDEDGGPVVVRPGLGRHTSSSTKSRLQTSKANTVHGSNKFAKPSTLGQIALQNSAAKRANTVRELPNRSKLHDDDGPKYSKEHLEELESSTPTTPRETEDSQLDYEMELDPSELEGAVIVESSAARPSDSSTRIFSESEIRERKERRARLAKEEEFLSFNEDEGEGELEGRQKVESRLVREDEDLGEGFDEFVDDGGLSLGKRAEKERRKQERQQMSELINAAEGLSSNSPSDSEAEGRIAYESAQTRAGLDGLPKPGQEDLDFQIPAKLTPIPEFSECLARFHAAVAETEERLKIQTQKMEQLREQEEEMMKRELEVQAFLDEAGKKYGEALEALGQTDRTSEGGGMSPGAALTDPFHGKRGLENLGTTPGGSEPENGERST